MSRRNKKVIGFIIGLVVLITGIAMRTTLPLTDYQNKPFGGIVMAIGMLIAGIFAYKLLKR